MKKKRKEYWKLVDAEAKAYKEVDIPALIGFHEELVHYKDHKLDLKFSWSAFTAMVVIDGILVLRINAHNMIFFSEEEVGKDAFTSAVARCEANIKAVN